MSILMWSIYSTGRILQAMDGLRGKIPVESGMYQNTKIR